MGYPDVRVTNSTSYPVTGGVTYESIFCKNDTFSLPPGPGTSWSNSRGVCLITSVYAVVTYNGTSVQASPYSSSGTSYSQYAVVQTGDGVFAVTRLTTSEGDSTGEIQHVEIPEGTDPKTL
jgi:hypothetical protein